LPRCQQLAEDLRSGRERFKHLHVAQLLKHALGLARRSRHEEVDAADAAAAQHVREARHEAPPRMRDELRYLYYEWPSGPAAAHRAELERFAALVGAEIRFSASTYQELYRALHADTRVDRAYLEYLGARYFRGA
jgi:hypothetical protein